jgi:DNA replication protein DnaC
VGKSHLAVALGVRAIENGFSVAFHRLEDLLAALKRDAEIHPARLRQRKHMNTALLIIVKWTPIFGPGHKVEEFACS